MFAKVLLFLQIAVTEWLIFFEHQFHVYQATCMQKVSVQSDLNTSVKH